MMQGRYGKYGGMRPKADEEIELKRYCEDLGMIYISTPFSRSAADFLDEINVPAFKIGVVNVIICFN